MGENPRVRLVDGQPPAPLRRMMAAPLELMINGRGEAAAHAWLALVDAYGSEGVTTAYQAWCDTVARAVGVERGSVDTLYVSYLSVADGRQVGADEVSPDVAWAGRVLSARVADDPAAFVALVRSVPDDATLHEYTGALLDLVATNVKAAAEGHPPPVRRFGSLREVAVYVSGI